MIGRPTGGKWTLRQLILAALFAVAFFVAAYFMWSTWINPRLVASEPRTTNENVSAPPALAPNPTIIPAQVNKDGIPEKLGGFTLSNFVVGKDALAEFSKLHGKGFDLLGGFRADYSNAGKDATLWVGQAQDAASAEAMTRLMADKISAGNPMFTDLQELEIGARLIYSVNGDGQQHFFYANGDKIVWLAIDAASAPAALHSLWGAVK